METKVRFHIEPEDFMADSILVDSPFNIIPSVGDIIQLDGQEGYYIVVRRQFMHCNVEGQPWINNLAIIIKKQ